MIDNVLRQMDTVPLESRYKDREGADAAVGTLFASSWRSGGRLTVRSLIKVSLKPFQRLAESRDSVSGGSRAAPLWVLREKPLVAVYGGETFDFTHNSPFANNPVNCLRTKQPTFHVRNAEAAFPTDIPFIVVVSVRRRADDIRPLQSLIKAEKSAERRR